MKNTNTLYKLRRKMQYAAVKIFGDYAMSRLFFLIVMKKNLNLNNPITFNEKIQHYKLFYCRENPLVIQCSDKFKFRDYLKEKGLYENLIPLVGAWKNADDIPWTELPEKFALKCNHGCGYNIICSNKDKMSEKEVKKLLNKWMREDFGYFNAEPHYNKIPKMIICEKFIENEPGKLPIDYKVHCFNGEPLFLLVCSDRKDNTSYYDYFDLNWNNLDYSLVKNNNMLFEKPETFNEMIRISRVIASDFPFVRVDFYQYIGRVFIGELTFVPAGGLDNTLPSEADYEIGKLLHIGYGEIL